MMKRKRSLIRHAGRLGLLALTIACTMCSEKEVGNVTLEDVAGNDEVLAFMRAFDGRGVLSDSSSPSPPQKSLEAFRFPSDLRVDLVLSEPEITQPVFMDFDHKGRLWVVQYNQYPYPKDLKVTEMDQHIRATFDKVPPPPGRGPQGADRITFFEDTDHDGIFDRSVDAITGLNIATSVAIGRGKIWVLNPPYLLAYPDADDDGIPDSDPVVHLEGFGLEDTHAVANSLRWGPDGWLYGAQGSTCTANISSVVSKNIRFNGQVIWRYHPETKVFEVFSEGGGNTFDIEIDKKGRLYSGDNGTSRGQYYKQGAYYPRNFGKHGALTNPYAFGHLSNMDLDGDRIRFTHAFVKYEGEGLPQQYAGKMIAINPLHGFVQLSKFESNGSTFRIVDESRILETTDHWFRPVDITLGPDGAVYIADWYDSRLSHVDPRDTWSKNNGRIYRVSNAITAEYRSPDDLSKLPDEDLMQMLSHKDRWYRQQTLRIIGDRRKAAMIPRLLTMLEAGDDQEALEALWALNLSGGFDQQAAIKGMRHGDPYVRMWAVRLSGEQKQVSERVAREMAGLAQREMLPEVRSQLASTARRLEAQHAIAVLENLLKYHDDSADPDIPLQIWWGLEPHTVSHIELVLPLFRQTLLWQAATVRNVLLERLAQRLVLQGDSAGFTACARLIKMAPSPAEVNILLTGVQEGLRGAPLMQLPAVMAEAIRPYNTTLREHAIAFSIRQGDEKALSSALRLAADDDAALGERLSCIRAFGDIYFPAAVPVLLKVVENNHSSPSLKQAALRALRRYDSPEIGARVVKAYPDKLRADPGVRLSALALFASRPEWARELLNAIDRKKKPGEDFIAHTIRREDVTEVIARQLAMLEDPQINAQVTRLWPSVGFSSASEKTIRIRQVSEVLKHGRGEPEAGRVLFERACGSCHQLFEKGGTLGPDLSGYDRKNISDLLINIIDPGAYVREGYTTYRITTRDGRLFSGTVSDRSGTTLTLNLVTGEKLVLPEEDIREMEAQPSIMPDKLLDALTDDEIRNLFAYLTKDADHR